MPEITTHALLDRIYAATAEEIPAILNAVTERFSEVWPQWELMTLAAESQNAEAQIRALQQGIALIRQCTKNDLP